MLFLTLNFLIHTPPPRSGLRSTRLCLLAVMPRLRAADSRAVEMEAEREERRAKWSGSSAGVVRSRGEPVGRVLMLRITPVSFITRVNEGNED